MNNYTDEELKINEENLYKHRWVWYHLALFCSLMMANALLIAILVVLALK